jgi:hypothetical protein
MRKLLILACGALLHTMVAAGLSFDEAAIVQVGDRHGGLGKGHVVPHGES